MSKPDRVDADIVIVGAGMAGSIAAFLLGKQGLSVVLLDRHAVCPPVFRAEKLEPDQVELLKKFNLLQERRPLGEPIGEILNFDNGVLSKFDTQEQYGIRYHDTVNQIRSRASEYSDFRVERVKDIRFSTVYPEVVLQNDQVITTKLVILACGYRSSLLPKLGIKLHRMDHLYSFSFGFDIEPVDDTEFPFTGFNYHLNVKQTGIDYLTLFLIDDVMRANLFTQLSSHDPRSKNLVVDPYKTLHEWFPDLEKHIGKFIVTSKVESFITQYYQVELPKVAGMVLIGDVFQSVSPTTGTGLSKVLNDVDALCHDCIPEWVSSRFDEAFESNRFYQHPQKLDADKESRLVWSWYHRKINPGSGFMRYLKKIQQLIAKNSKKFLRGHP